MINSTKIQPFNTDFADRLAYTVPVPPERSSRFRRIRRIIAKPDFKFLILDIYFFSILSVFTFALCFRSIPALVITTCLVMIFPLYDIYIRLVRLVE